MAIYHLSVDIIKRSAGHSSVAAAAYRAGENLTDEKTEEKHDYTRRRGVVHQEIMLPEHAPKEYQDRQTLWNAVEKAEKATDAQVARSIEFSLPRELDREQQIKLARKYIKENFVDQGMCADWVIHDKGDGNPHVHVLLTMRALDSKGKWKAKEKKEYALDENGEKIPLLDKDGNQKVDSKNRKQWKRITVQKNEWNDQELTPKWRKAWQDICNDALERAGLDDRIDCRSYADQGSEKLPQAHMGKEAAALERKGVETDIGVYNREVVSYNEDLDALEQAEQKLMEERRKLIEDLRLILKRNYEFGQNILREIEQCKDKITSALVNVYKMQKSICVKIANAILFRNHGLLEKDYIDQEKDKYRNLFQDIDKKLDLVAGKTENKAENVTKKGFATQDAPGIEALINKGTSKVLLQKKELERTEKILNDAKKLKDDFTR